MLPAVSPASTPTFQLQFGTNGSEPGQFKQPFDLAADASGGVWVADSFNNRLQHFDAAGEFLSQFGEGGGEEGQLNLPVGMATDAQGDLWVANFLNHHVQEFSPTGELLTEFGEAGSEPGQFVNPTRIAIDSEGDVWVADSGNDRLQKFSSEGEYLGGFGEEGSGDGQFNFPAGIAIDPNGDLWVVDRDNDRVQKFDPEGEYLAQFGEEGSGQGQLKAPTGIGIDPLGNLWVTDNGNHRVQGFDDKGEYFTQFGEEGSGDGQFKSPAGIALAPGGRIWVADTQNHRVQRWAYRLETTITEGAYSTTARTTTAFQLVSEFGATFECRLDAGPWQSCSPHPGYADLAAGPHHFEARAVDEDGAVDPTPAQRDWVVDPLGPVERPEVGGTPRIDRTLSVSNGTWGGSAPTSYSYQWFRCQSSNPATFGSCQAISGATGAQYQLTPGDEGQHLVAEVTANRDGGEGMALQSTETQTSTLSRFSLPALEEVIRSALSERLVFSGCKGDNWQEGEEVPPTLTCGLWMTSAAATNPILVVEDEAVNEQLAQPMFPTLSKDGSLIAYVVNATNCLMVVPAQANGSPKEVDCAEPEEIMPYHHPAFTPDGEIVYADWNANRIWKINVDGTGKETVVTWPNAPRFTHPSVAPDGVHLAFSSTKGPSGEATEGVWVTTMAGTEPRLIQSQRSVVDWSPDGGKLALLFDDQPGTPGNFVGIYDLATSTRAKFGPTLVWNYGSTWSADGERIAVLREPADVVYGDWQVALIDPATGSEQAILGDFLTNVGHLHLSFRLGADPGAIVPDDLLERYRPVVYYHPEENYFADAAEGAIEWHENLVYEATPDSVVADNIEGGLYEDLDATWLGNRPFSEDDVLDEIGDNEEAADWGHGQPAMANHVYGNAIPTADGEVIWLQYWFFYYYNDSINAGGTDFGTHEGDWEFVQYAYDVESDQITEVTYNQHDGAETCLSNALDYVITDDGRVAPAVYSAKSSHASYFEPGDYDLEILPPLNLGNDLASADAGPTELTMSRLVDEPWFDWGGHWGGTFKGYIRGEASSPTGPGHGANEKEIVDPDRVAGEGGCRQD